MTYVIGIALHLKEQILHPNEIIMLTRKSVVVLTGLDQKSAVPETKTRPSQNALDSEMWPSKSGLQTKTDLEYYNTSSCIFKHNQVTWLSWL